MSALARPWRVALVEPPYLFWDRSMDRLRQAEETIPGIGMLVLAAVARAARPRRGDLRRQGQRRHARGRRASRSPRFRPDVVGISATTISITNAARIAARVKETAPRGRHDGRRPARERDPGAHARGVSRSSTTASSARARSRFFELLDRLRGRARDRGRPRAGLSRERVRRRQSRARRTSTTSMPCRCRRGTACPDSRTASSRRCFSYPRTPVATLVTSRGCPFSCSFCDRSTSGKLGRMHSVE